MNFQTRDEAREAITKAGVTCENVTELQLSSLLVCLRKALKESTNYNGTYKMTRHKASKYMYCKTEQWKSREAISFNDDGFIGLCGWADNNNLQPILRGIEAWLKLLPTLDYNNA